MDGRSDFYGSEFERQYLDVIERELRMGTDPGPLWRQHDFNAPERAAGRRAQGIQPLARRL